jgi:hypothetical protein
MLALLLPSPCRPLLGPEAPSVAHAAAPRPPRHALAWWRLGAGLLLAGGVLAALSGCALRPPQSAQETQIDSVMPGAMVGAGIVGKPFCLHLRYRNHFWPAYSDAQAEAWISEGSCASKGPARPVSALRLSWWYDWQDTQSNRQCLNTDRCRMDEQTLLVGRNIRCAAAHASDGPHTAYITTDEVVCH